MLNITMSSELFKFVIYFGTLINNIKNIMNLIYT